MAIKCIFTIFQLPDDGDRKQEQDSEGTKKSSSPKNHHGSGDAMETDPKVPILPQPQSQGSSSHDVYLLEYCPTNFEFSKECRVLIFIKLYTRS